MLQFLDRSRELAFLESKYQDAAAQLIILYGRRRIGKTELVTKFCSNKENIYFLGRLEAKDDTIRRLNECLVTYFKDSSLVRNPIRNWERFFEYLGLRDDLQLVLIIDEFPFIVDRFPEITSILQDKWDSTLRKGKLMMILTGSSIGMMKQHALDYKSPLYGRRTGQWKLDKMNVVHLKAFFPWYAIEDLITVYACIDTIPGYLSRFNPTKTVLENIRDKILSKGEFLYDEVEILLREELRDPSNYMSIMAAIAGGTTKLNEINNATKLDKSLLSKYIHSLERLEIVESVQPVTFGYKAELKTKGSIHVIKDNFVDFWFRFVYANKNELERGNIDAVFSNPSTFNEYLGRKFERFVLEILPLLGLGAFTRTGKWWHGDVEIDAVGLDDSNKRLLACECKWTDNVNAMSIAKDLAPKIKEIHWNDGSREETMAIFAKSFSRTTTSFEGIPVQCLDLNTMELMLFNSPTASSEKEA